MLRQAGIELEQAQRTEQVHTFMIIIAFKFKLLLNLLQETSLKVSQYKSNLVMCKVCSLKTSRTCYMCL